MSLRVPRSGLVSASHQGPYGPEATEAPLIGALGPKAPFVIDWPSAKKLSFDLVFFASVYKRSHLFI